MAQRHVILGASLAGATAAITPREEGADGDMILIGAELQPPYQSAKRGIQTMFGTRATQPSLRRVPDSFASEAPSDLSTIP